MATFAEITVTLGTSYAQPFIVLNTSNEPFTVAQYTGATYALTVTNGPTTLIPSSSWTASSINTATGAVTMNLTAAAMTSAGLTTGSYTYTFVVTLSDGTITDQAQGPFIVNSQAVSNVLTPQTSWTYTAIPGIGEIVLYAFYLCGVRATALTQEHMETSRTAAQLLIGRWNTGVNLWAIDLLSIPLAASLGTYQLPANTITVLDVYLSNASGQNRIITPFSRSEYASLSEPASVGRPTSYWFDRLLSPSINFWPLPDGSEPTVNIYRVRQIQDPNLQGDKNLEAPIYFLEPFALGLAHRLSMIWAPERTAALKAEYMEALADAQDQNVEFGNFYISPTLSGYYRT
jgi:hypothetical protein